MTIVVESLEPDGSLDRGARVRVTDGDKTWEGTVTETPAEPDDADVRISWEPQR